MRFLVDEDIFRLYPELTLVALLVHSVRNGKPSEDVKALADQETRFTRNVFLAMPVADHPNIQVWRRAYQAFGPASRYHSSVEALVTRVVKGKSLPTINPLVDLYNVASLKYLVPIGGEDLAEVRGGLRLSRAQGSESFIPLGETKDDPPEIGEVGYFDEKGCVCRRFNWREGDRTKLTAATKHAILVLEGLPPTGEIELKEAGSTLGSWIGKFCGGWMEYFFLDARRPSIQFDPLASRVSRPASAGATLHRPPPGRETGEAT